MPSSQIGTYHLADNPKYFEIQRNNNFEFIVTDIDGILKAGALGTGAEDTYSNAQEMLTLSVVGAPIPHYKQEKVEIKRGNSTLKYAGVPTFETGKLKFNDFIGADVKGILKAWQNLSYNVDTEKVGSVRNTKYKKDCWLIEYGPDYEKIRTWRLYGCWISALSEGDYSAEDNQKHQIEADIEYDRAVIESTEV